MNSNFFFCLYIMKTRMFVSLCLCRSKVEQVTTEDLVELSEIEKRNLGQVFVFAFNFDSLLSFTLLNLCLE